MPDENLVRTRDTAGRPLARPERPIPWPEYHPYVKAECGVDECFAGNVAVEDLERHLARYYQWDTARIGQVALDLSERHLRSYVPVFVKKAEVEAAGFTFMKLKDADGPSELVNKLIKDFRGSTGKSIKEWMSDDY